MSCCVEYSGNSPSLGVGSGQGGSGGGSGVTLGEVWTFSATITDADPGSKKFRLNNATQASATFIYISKTSDNGADWGNVLLELKSGDNVYVQESADSSRFQLFDVTGSPTDATTYVKIPVISLDSGSDLGNNKKCGFVFQFAGAGAGATGLPTGYIDGVEVNYATASTVTIETGKVRNDADDGDINITLQLTADITSSGANGLDTGSEASNTWYSVWAIWNSTGPTVAALLSASATSPTLPSGYTKKRLLGWVKNDSSSDFIEFRCFGKGRSKRFFYLEWWPVLTNGSATSWTAIDCSAYVPPGVFNCSADIKLDNSFSETGAFGQFDGSTTYPHEIQFAESGGTINAFCSLDSSRRLGYAVSNFTVDMDVNIFGWNGYF